MKPEALTRRYVIPSSVPEAAELLREYGSQSCVVAGGSDLMLLRQQGLAPAAHMLDLSRIPELQKLRATDAGLEVGSMVTLAQLERSEFIESRFPMIAEAARSIATPVIRQSATIGGNLLVENRCTYYNQSQFWRDSIGSCLKDTGDTCQVTGLRNGRCYSRNVSDMAPALIALGAEAVILEGGKETRSALEKLYSSDGLFPHGGISAESLLLRVEIPAPPSRFYFRKLRLRKSVDFSSLTVAGTRNSAGDARICLNAIAMSPILVTGKAEALDFESVIHEARIKSKIVDNDALPIDYRKEMLAQFLRELWKALELKPSP